MTFPVEILRKLPPNLRVNYLAYQPEIQAIRKQWAEIRNDMKANAHVEHNMVARDYHPAERDILAYLVPDLDSEDPKIRLGAMRWILKQPWGEDFKPAPVEKAFRGIELGSSNAA